MPLFPRLKQFHRRHIYPHDPAGLILRHSLVTMLAVGLAILLTYPWEIVTWGGVAAFFFSQVPPGVPLARRRRVVLFLVLCAGLAVIPATIMDHGWVLPTMAVILAAFACFLSAALNPNYATCALWVLVLCVVAMGMPADMGEALRRGAAVVAGGMMSWLCIYVVFPVRPDRLLRSALGLVVRDLSHVMGLMIQAYPSGQIDQNELARAKRQVLDSLDRFRRLPRFLQLSFDQGQPTQKALISLGIDLVRVYENLIAFGEIRQMVSDSELFNEFQPLVIDYAVRTRKLLERLEPAGRRTKGNGDGQALVQQMEDSLVDIRARRKHPKGPGEPREWLVLSTSIFALRSMAKDLSQARDQRQVVKQFYESPPKPAPAGLCNRITASLRRDVTPLRTACQAAAVAGAAMFLAKFFQIHFGFLVVVIGLMLIKPDLGSTIDRGKRQLLGTLLGAVAAAGLVLLAGAGNMISLGASILGAFLCVYLRNFPHAILNAGLATFTVVSLVFNFTSMGWEMSMLRVAGTGLALAMGLAAAFFLWPQRAGNRLGRELAQVMASTRGFFSQIYSVFLTGGMSADPTGSLRVEVRARLQTANATFSAAGHEPGTKAHRAEGFQRLLLHHRHIFDLLLAMDAAASQARENGSQEPVANQLRAYAESQEKAIERLERLLAHSAPTDAPPDMEGEHQALVERLIQLGQGDAGQDKPLDDLLNLAGFLWGMRSMQRALEQEAEDVKGLAGE